MWVILQERYESTRVVGYFDNQDDADKYCVLHKDLDYFALPAKDLSGEVDLSDIVLKYTYEVIFDYHEHEWIPRHEPNRYIPYCQDILKSDEVWTMDYCKPWVGYVVNTDHRDYDLAVNIATKYHNMLLDMGEGNLYKKNIDRMNKLLKQPVLEQAEKNRQKKIEEQERAELARLKAKYEC